MTGTFINVGTVIVGSIIGMMFKSKLPDRVIKTIFQGLGLFTLLLGIVMFFKSTHLLVIVFSIIVGSVVGELLNLEDKTERLADKVRKRLRFGDERFSDGLVTAFLLYCMGSLTVLGAIEEGLGNGYQLLLTKAIMDGFASVALASAFGVGVLFSIVPLFIYQGALTLLSQYLGKHFSDTITDDLSAVGGLLLVGLAFKVLEIKKVKVLNIIPSLIFVVLFSWLYLRYFN